MKILLLGYYGFDNFGDEWSLAEVAASLNEVIPSAEVAVISGDPSRTHKLHGLPAVNRTPAALRRAIMQCDLLICGGGSLLQDATSTRSLFYYLSIIGFAALNRKKIILWGQGVGPLNQKQLHPLVRQVLNQACLITLRDQHSIELLRSLGVVRPLLQLTADPSFGGAIFNQRSFTTTEPILTLVLRDWPGQGRQWLDSIAQAIAGYCQQRHWEVVLCSFQPNQDRALATAMLAKLESLGVGASITSDWVWLEDTAEIFIRSSLVVAGRYHAMALAAVLGIPAVGLGYDPKVNSLGNQLSLPVLSWEDLQDPDRTRAALEAGDPADPRLVQDLSRMARSTQQAVVEVILGEAKGE